MYEIIPLRLHSDERGWLAEILRREKVKSEFGQIYLTTTKPGKVRANHYHKRKTEWFCVIKGKAKLFLKKVGGSNIEEIILREDRLMVVKIPPKVTHAIKNIGDEPMYLLAYTTEPYDSQDPDTFTDEPIRI